MCNGRSYGFIEEKTKIGIFCNYTCTGSVRMTFLGTANPSALCTLTLEHEMLNIAEWPARNLSGGPGLRKSLLTVYLRWLGRHTGITYLMIIKFWRDTQSAMLIIRIARPMLRTSRVGALPNNQRKVNTDEMGSRILIPRIVIMHAKRINLLIHPIVNILEWQCNRIILKPPWYVARRNAGFDTSYVDLTHIPWTSWRLPMSPWTWWSGYIATTYVTKPNEAKLYTGHWIDLRDAWCIFYSRLRIRNVRQNAEDYSASEDYSVRRLGCSWDVLAMSNAVDHATTLNSLSHRCARSCMSSLLCRVEGGE